MHSILEFVDNKQVLDYARRLTPNIWLGLNLFKVQTTDEITYEYIKGAGGISSVKMAEVVAWESEAPTAPRESVTTVQGELPPIKQKSRIKEKELIKIFSPRGTSERQLAINKLFDDVKDRVDGIYARANDIIMKSLANGSVVFTSEGMKLTVDWGVPANHKVVLAGVNKWSDTVNSNPVQDMLDLQAQIKMDGGVTPNEAITSTKVVGYLLQNQKIKLQILGDATSSRILSLTGLNLWLTSMGLPTIYAYDETSRIINPSTHALTEQRFFPEEKFVMFNRTALGDTLVGPTSEAIVGAGYEAAPGVWAEVFETRDPVNVWTYAVATMFPTFPGAGNVGQITCY